MNILVTGGAGYIGSHTCKVLAGRGHTVTVYDNLSSGHRDLIKWGDFEHGDIRDAARLRAVLRARRCGGVIHFAAYASVNESIADPGKYYDNNAHGTLCLLAAMRDEGVGCLVVSGTCAVYGQPERVPIAEDAPKAPVNPYGMSKLVMEHMLADFERAHALAWMSLRYFNAAGCDPERETGERHAPETHLIPRVLMAMDGEIPELRVFGDDYDTPDGTCIRDYVHVTDLAEAHVLALEHLAAGRPSRALNLGTGRGVSVREILKEAEKVCGKAAPYRIEGRRAGDPPRLAADAASAEKILGWKPTRDLTDILRTARDWHEHDRRAGRTCGT
jgi:UDP-glucose-4-epimerase GalE